MYLSVVIPAYNEEDRILATLECLTRYLEMQSYDAEVIVVNDGSQDRTAEVAGQFARRCETGAPTGGKRLEASSTLAEEASSPFLSDRRTAEGDNPALRFRLVNLPHNRGKGNAVRVGMLGEASGDYRVFYDADGSAPIDELEKMWPRFEDGADIVIGSRALPDSDVQVHQARYRESMGRVFNLMLRCAGLTRFRDTQCGFKGFTAHASEIVFARQTIDRFGFDAEVLYIAYRHGLRVDEVPVRWINSASSRVHPVTDSARMFLDMLRIRVRAFAGRYR